MKGLHLSMKGRLAHLTSAFLICVAWLFAACGLCVASAQGLDTQVLHWEGDSLVVEIAFPPVRFDTVDLAQGWIVPRMAGAALPLEGGVPDLPRFALSYPLTDKELRVCILDVEFDPYFDMDVAPAYGRRLRGEDSVWWRMPGAVYSRDALYPSDYASLGGAYMHHSQREQSVLLFPARYNPGTRTLLVVRRLRLSVSGVAASEPMAVYRGAQSEGTTHSGATLRGGASAEQLLIVAPRKYYAALQPLIDWKRLCGYEVDLQPFGPAEELHDTVSLARYVRERYMLNSHLRYLLLVGGRKDIPSLRRAGPNRKGDSDQAYGQVMGNDAFSEVYVGRFSARTPDHVRIQVERTLRYERDLHRGDMWLARTLAISSNETITGDQGETDREHARGLLKQCLKGSYTQGDSVFDGTPLGMRAELSRLLNAGTGFVNYTGHGYPTRWKTTDFRVEDVLALTNAGSTPFVLDVACSNGEMDAADPCFAEAWLWAEHGGVPSGAVAIAAASTMQEWVEPMRMQDIFTSSVSMLDGQPNNTYGAVFAQAMSGMLQVYSDPYSVRAARQTADTWNIFGDPSLRLRTCAPRPVEVQFSNHMEAGIESYRLGVSRREACVVMRITPADGAEPRYHRAEVNAGYADFHSLSLGEGDRVVLAVTGCNLESFVSPEIEVRAPQPAQLLFRDVRLLTADQQIVEVVSPSQQLELVGQLDYLAGALPLDGVSLHCSVDPSDAAELLADATIELPPFTAYGQNTAALRIPLRVSQAHSDASRFTLSLEARAQDQTIAQLSLPVVVSAPGVALDSIQLIGDENHDGRIDPGEEFQVGIWMTNTGITALSSGMAYLRLAVGSEVLESQLPFGDIPPRGAKRFVSALRMPAEGLDSNSICTLSVVAKWLANSTSEFQRVLPVGRAYRGLREEVLGYPFAQASTRQVVSFLVPAELLPSRMTHLAAVRIPVRSAAGEGDVLGRVHAALMSVDTDQWLDISMDSAFTKGELRLAMVADGWVELPIPSFYYEPGNKVALRVVSEGAAGQLPYAVQALACPSRSLVGLTARAGEEPVPFETTRIPHVAFRAAQLAKYHLAIEWPDGVMPGNYSVRIGDRIWRMLGTTPFEVNLLEGVHRIEIQSDLYQDTVVHRHIFGLRLQDTVRLQRASAQRVRLRVCDMQEQPLQGLEVRLAGGRWVSNAAGDVELMLTPGVYPVHLEAGEQSFQHRIVVTKGVREYTLRVAYRETGVDVHLSSVYPNPVVDRLAVRSAEKIDRVQVYTQYGVLVRSVMGHGGDCTMDLGGCAPGIYLVEVRHASGRTVVHRVAVQ